MIEYLVRLTPEIKNFYLDNASCVVINKEEKALPTGYYFLPFWIEWVEDSINAKVHFLDNLPADLSAYIKEGRIKEPVPIWMPKPPLTKDEAFPVQPE